MGGAKWADVLDPWNLFHDKETTGGETATADYPPELKSFISQYLPQYQPGADSGLDFSKISQATPYEQTGLNTLGQFQQGTGTGAGFDQAQNYYQSVLSPSFLNPEQNPLIQALTSTAGTQFSKIMDQVKAARGAGNFFTSETGQQQTNAGVDFANNQSLQIGSILQALQGQQAGAAGALFGMDKYQNMDIPLAQINASQQFGGLQRTLDTAQFEAQYQDFARKQSELGGVANTAVGAPYGFNEVTSPIVEQENPVMAAVIKAAQIANLLAGGSGGGIGGGGTQGGTFPSQAQYSSFGGGGVGGTPSGYSGTIQQF